ncbi:hypothetical protein BVI434_1160010 [Burkholderia vietnamiensis]|nr:hypothetical protein BVI434_1160010 [Burkholderia vietnamiensis]
MTQQGALAHRDEIGGLSNLDGFVEVARDPLGHMLHFLGHGPLVQRNFHGGVVDRPVIEVEVVNQRLAARCIDANLSFVIGIVFREAVLGLKRRAPHVRREWHREYRPVVVERVLSTPVRTYGVLMSHEVMHPRHGRDDRCMHIEVHAATELNPSSGNQLSEPHGTLASGASSSA